ncbi:Interleukin-12 receptor subunit beta-2 [Merluccius polli]|uniref:Interleukin-12 receptor subunit beta-2 n=1 Tax=Merluccius polli TaxID=89951 RepID=A0AA47PA57_MERPO|nr:Interleukin-12 receptor subunit beta-2 [Merluccius polli]
MSPGVPPRSLLALIAALAVRWSNSEHTTCQIWSSAGKVVQRGSSLRMFCTFESMCQRAVYVEGVRHDHTSLNSTTVYIKVVNITGHLTCLCQCADRPTAGEECGIDVVAGSGNYTGGSVNRTGFSVGSTLARVKLNLKPSIQSMSVKVYVCNDLGSAESDTYKFTLRDIVKPSPPALILVECSSRSCNITWDRPLETHLEIQYRFQPDSVRAHDWQTSSSRLPSVHSLQPFRWYSFRARVKLSHGLWSDWSAPLSNMTQEEGNDRERCCVAAPDKELDVWVSRATSHPNTLMVYWKPLSGSEARGRLLGYRVIINNSHAGNCTTHTVGAQATCLSVQSCDTCLVTVSAFNSIGSSPPARLPTLVHTAQPPQDLQVFASKCNVSLYWRKADPTLLSTGYLVEWYPQGQQFEKLQWMQLSTAESHALITDMESYECYDGAVYVFYKSSVGKASFEGVNTLVTVPQGAPSVTSHLWGDTVTLTWTQVPRVKRGGCVRNYTIYIKNNKDSKDKLIYQFPASVHQCTTDRLPPATYMVWMTAWTAEGEGPGSEKVEIVIQRKTHGCCYQVNYFHFFFFGGGYICSVLPLV